MIIEVVRKYYYISHVVRFDRVAVLETLKNCGRELEGFNGFLNRTEELKHSDEKFRFSGDAGKPPFEEVYYTVKEYIKDILP